MEALNLLTSHTLHFRPKCVVGGSSDTPLPSQGVLFVESDLSKKAFEKTFIRRNQTTKHTMVFHKRVLLLTTFHHSLFFVVDSILRRFGSIFGYSRSFWERNKNKSLNIDNLNPLFPLEEIYF